MHMTPIDGTPEPHHNQVVVEKISLLIGRERVGEREEDRETGKGLLWRRNPKQVLLN